MSLVTSDRMLWLEGIAAHARTIPDKAALRYICHESGIEEVMTYASLQRRSEHVASVLQDKFPSGGSMLLCVRNGPEFLVALIGAFKAGLSVLPVSLSSTVHELREIARVVEASVFVRSESSSHRIDDPSVPEMDSDVLCSGHRGNVDGLHGSPGLMLRTSGTTGMPKVVFRDMKSLDNVSENICRALNLTSEDSVLALVPMCHSYGIEHCVLAPLFAGSAIVSVEGIDSFPIHALIRDSEVTVFPGFPFAYERMIEELPDSFSHSLRMAYSAGSQLPGTVSSRFTQQFGIKLGQLYGSTEVGSVLFNDPNTSGLSARSVGVPLADVRVLILDLENPDPACPLLSGTEGQVAVASSTMLSHYVGQDMDDMIDGYFLTGDLGVMDDSGAVEITGRIKHQIDIAGAKVNPLEVEAAVLEISGIRECVVMPCIVRGTLMRLRAVLVVDECGPRPEVSDIKDHLRSRLSAYKIPRLYEFRSELPRTPLGKILRSEEGA